MNELAQAQKFDELKNQHKSCGFDRKIPKFCCPPEFSSEETITTEDPIEVTGRINIKAGFPGLGGGNGGRKGGAGGGDGGGKRKSQPPASSSSASTTSSGGGYCPGGSLQDCIRFCPRDDDGEEFSSCVTDCGNQCPA